MSKLPHVTICICTFMRYGMLDRLLRKLIFQKTENKFSFSVVVSDNDPNGSAKKLVEDVTTESGMPIKYCIQPVKNIALARNTAVLGAKGDYIAFIDDDEFPNDDWLLTLLQACQQLKVSGILGPVLAHFEREPPKWVRIGKFYERPRHRTGYALDWAECRTGNALVNRVVANELKGPFDEDFVNGGEDQDFFRRASSLGHKFLWCDEAIVHETVPPHRWSRKFLLRRALLRGRNTLKHSEGQVLNLIKSLIAVPAYSAALPFLMFGGHHLFMIYLIKLCDHVGRLLACLNLNPIRERGM
jgi:succinoglycan biosynthesis protein ExoM